jgi:hypothetical protein
MVCMMVCNSADWGNMMVCMMVCMVVCNSADWGRHDGVQAFASKPPEPHSQALNSFDYLQL